MEKAQLAELHRKAEETIKNLELQFNAQMNWLAGRKAILEELMAEQPDAKAQDPKAGA